MRRFLENKFPANCIQLTRSRIIEVLSVLEPTAYLMRVMKLAFDKPPSHSNRGVVASLKRLILLVLCISISSLLANKVSTAQSFEGLGDLSGGVFYSNADGVSNDGSVVVGQANSGNGNEAYRWTANGGMVGLGDFSGGDFTSGVREVSADGSVVVGHGFTEDGRQAFRWTENDGMVSVGDLPGGSISSNAYSVSADGSVVVGFSFSTNGQEAYRWTSGTGMVGLGELSGGAFQSDAHNISDDGSVIVGNSESINGREAFIWSELGGMLGLGDLAGGDYESRANDVSADGSIVVGWGTTATGREAYRWTSDTGMVGLGSLTIGGSSRARTISDDGVIVGFSRLASGVGDTAFIWDEINGMRSLQDLIESTGVELTGWDLTNATDISADGMTIVGRGVNPNGDVEGWRFNLSPVPEPSSLAVLSIAGIVCLICRRKRIQRCSDCFS